MGRLTRSNCRRSLFTPPGLCSTTNPTPATCSPTTFPARLCPATLPGTTTRASRRSSGPPPPTHPSLISSEPAANIDFNSYFSFFVLKARRAGRGWICWVLLHFVRVRRCVGGEEGGDGRALLCLCCWWLFLLAFAKRGDQFLINVFCMA